MAEYFSPGIYVEEIDNGPRSIEGVGTSVAGFVGLAEKGPVVGAPLLCNNFKDFTRQFGGFLNEFTFGENRFLANSVEQFFANGGTRCYVMRVAPSDAKSAAVVSGPLSVTAANPGKWGNRIQVTLITIAKRKFQLIAKSGDSYIAKNVEGLREGDIVRCNDEYNRISSIYDNTITFEQPFTEDVVDEKVIPTTLLYRVTLGVSVRFNDDVENFADLSLNPMDPDYIVNRLASSELIKVELSDASEIANPVSILMGDDSENGLLTLSGGTDGSMTAVNAATFLGEDNGPGKRTGLAAFVENNIVSMLAIPGITIPEVVVGLVGHCENLKSRFAVIDMPEEMYKIDELVGYRSMIDSTYAAMYHPWIQVFDRATNKPGFVPPSGAVMGVYSRTDIARGVHKAPANETVFCTGLRTPYTKDEQDLLNPEGINLIRSIPGQGIKVWGARTASSNSSFKYVNVRRLFIFVEESIKASTNWVVFEPNDATLWNRVQMTISSFLDTLWRAGMFAGATPAESFFVEIGPSTMTQDDILNGRLICNIGIAPSRPAEFVIFRVSQMTSGAGA